MKSKTLKHIWNRRKSNRFLLLEFVISFIVLFGISVILISLFDSYSKPLGFNYQDVLEINLQSRGSLPQEQYESDEKQIYERIETFQNVESITKLNFNSIFRFGYTTTNKFSYDEGKNYTPYLFGATDEFADVFQLNLLEGRWFDEQDDALKNRPIVINKKLKQEVFGNSNALGNVVKTMDDQECVVVGVIDDFRYIGDFSKPRYCCFARKADEINLPYRQNLGNTSTWFGGFDNYYIRVNKQAGLDFEERIHSVLVNQFPNWQITLTPLTTLRKDYFKRVWIPVIFIILVSTFLIFNVVLGLFGVLWYNISLRRSEIGLRMAVGANKANVYKQFVGEMLVISSLGVLPGIIIASQFPILKVFNVETKIYLLAILLAVLLIYLLVILCALLPSAQATKIRPAIALHED